MTGVDTGLVMHNILNQAVRMKFDDKQKLTKS